MLSACAIASVYLVGILKERWHYRAGTLARSVFFRDTAVLFALRSAGASRYEQKND
jgi:hypothetical protein